MAQYAPQNCALEGTIWQRAYWEDPRMRALALGVSILLAAAGGVGAQQAPSASRATEINRLHDALHLTAAQEAAWGKYAAAIAPNPQVDGRRRAAEELMPTLPTPRRVALMESTMAADQADLRQQGAAVTEFYNQLTPAQQQAFDRETLPGKAQSSN
jgi:hypothetical protein